MHGVKRTNVIASPPGSDSATGVPAFVDAFGHVAAAYGARQGAYVLVRPDGYVGWIGLQSGLPDLRSYLNRVSAGP